MSVPLVCPRLVRGSLTVGILEVSGGAFASRDRQQGTLFLQGSLSSPPPPVPPLPWSLWPVLREQPVLADPTHRSTLHHLCQRLCSSAARWTVSSAPTGPTSSPSPLGLLRGPVHPLSGAIDGVHLSVSGATKQRCFFKKNFLYRRILLYNVVLDSAMQ